MSWHLKVLRYKGCVKSDERRDDNDEISTLQNRNRLRKICQIFCKWISISTSGNRIWYILSDSVSKTLRALWASKTGHHPTQSSLGILLFSKIFYLKEGKSKPWWIYNLEMTTVSIFQVFEKQQQVEVFSVLQSHPSPISLVAE